MSGSQTTVHLHNGILHNGKKGGAPTLCDSMDGTGEHFDGCQMGRGCGKIRDLGEGIKKNK